MKLSPAAELAVRGVLTLAEEYGKGPVTLDTICAKRDLPKQYLVKIFSSLARVGLVTPVRGKNGGYLLGRDPAQITLLDVIEAVEGPIILNYCQHKPSQCTDAACRVRPMWTELQQKVRESLSSMSLADCLSPAPATVPSAK